MGNFPTFVSQPFVPVALLFWPRQWVIGFTFGSNILWAILVRYRVVILSLAIAGMLLVRLKWLGCPLAAYLLYHRGSTGLAVLALFWPLPLAIPGGMVPVQVGKIQNMFMQRLGYQPTQ